MWVQPRNPPYMAIWQRGGGGLGGIVQRPWPRSSIAAATTTAPDNFKLVTFKIRNADFNLKAQAWKHDFDFADDTVKWGGMVFKSVAALDSHSVSIECGIIECLAVLLIGWGSLSAEKMCWCWHWLAVEAMCGL